MQEYITNEVMRLSEPYVPFDKAGLYAYPGRLKGSVHIENKTDVVWNGPYARYLYYHPEFHFQEAPIRGAYWVDRMLQNGGMKRIEDGMRKMERRI